MSFDLIKLEFRLGEASIGSVSVDGSRDETDFYSIVTVEGFLKEKRIYGIDPVSALGEGVRLIERLTEEVRFNEETDASDLRILLDRK